MDAPASWLGEANVNQSSSLPQTLPLKVKVSSRLPFQPRSTASAAVLWPRPPLSN